MGIKRTIKIVALFAGISLGTYFFTTKNHQSENNYYLNSNERREEESISKDPLLYRHLFNKKNKKLEETTHQEQPTAQEQPTQDIKAKNREEELGKFIFDQLQDSLDRNHAKETLLEEAIESLRKSLVDFYLDDSFRNPESLSSEDYPGFLERDAGIYVSKTLPDGRYDAAVILGGEITDIYDLMGQDAFLKDCDIYPFSAMAPDENGETLTLQLMRNTFASFNGHFGSEEYSFPNPFYNKCLSDVKADVVGSLVMEMIMLKREFNFALSTANSLERLRDVFERYEQKASNLQIQYGVSLEHNCSRFGNGESNELAKEEWRRENDAEISPLIFYDQGCNFIEDQP